MFLGISYQNYKTINPLSFKCKNYINMGDLTKRKPAIQKPYSYEVIERGLIAKGGYISEPGELRFLENNGYRSVLSLLKKGSDNDQTERVIIDEYNSNHPERAIVLDNINIRHNPDLSGALQRAYQVHHHNLAPQDRKILNDIRAQLKKKINTLPLPIYMHCIAGSDVSTWITPVVKDLLDKNEII